MSESETDKRQLVADADGVFIDDDGRVRAKMVKNSKGGIPDSE
ncbi:hypothetical protein [Natrialba asiatica]|nr:hypothetical protein [Natrialba asiatica]